MVFVLGSVLENEVLDLERCLKISLVKLSFLFFMLGKRKNLKRRRRKKKWKQMAKKLMKAQHRIIQWQGMIKVMILFVHAFLQGLLVSVGVICKLQKGCLTCIQYLF